MWHFILKLSDLILPIAFCFICYVFVNNCSMGARPQNRVHWINFYLLKLFDAYPTTMTRRLNPRRLRACCALYTKTTKLGY